MNAFPLVGLPPGVGMLDRAKRMVESWLPWFDADADIKRARRKEERIVRAQQLSRRLRESFARADDRLAGRR